MYVCVNGRIHTNLEYYIRKNSALLNHQNTTIDQLTIEVERFKSQPTTKGKSSDANSETSEQPNKLQLFVTFFFQKRATPPDAPNHERCKLGKANSMRYLLLLFFITVASCNSNNNGNNNSAGVPDDLPPL